MYWAKQKKVTEPNAGSVNLFKFEDFTDTGSNFKWRFYITSEIKCDNTILNTANQKKWKYHLKSRKNIKEKIEINEIWFMETQIERISLSNRCCMLYISYENDDIPSLNSKINESAAVWMHAEVYQKMGLYLFYYQI